MTAITEAEQTVIRVATAESSTILYSGEKIWFNFLETLLPPLLLCPTPEYRPSRSPCRRGAWKAHICQYQPPLAHPTW